MSRGVKHRERRARRPLALFGALALALALVAAGSGVRHSRLGSGGPISPTSLTQGSPTPAQASPLTDPTPAPSPSTTPARSATPRSTTAPRRPRVGWPNGWQVPSTPKPASSSRVSKGTSLAGADITAIGDSIMVDAMPNLRVAFPGIAIDAVAGRQVDSGLSVMQVLATQGRLDPNVVIELGTNGTFTWAQLKQFLSLAQGRHLVLLTNHCPYCSWVPSNNELMATGCTAAAACSVADWETLANFHPEWFAGDGVHMPIGGAGGSAYAALIARTLNETPPTRHLHNVPS